MIEENNKYNYKLTMYMPEGLAKRMIKGMTKDELEAYKQSLKASPSMHNHQLLGEIQKAENAKTLNFGLSA